MKVDFFIMGPPRCGTTALSFYLSQHPEVCFAEPKEPWYFCKDLVTGYPDPCQSDEEYHQRFFGHYEPDVHTKSGEGSPTYLMSDCAASEIYTYNPGSRLIVMARNPVEIARSMHSAWYSRGPRHEDIEDFETAWRAQEDRAAGRRLPDGVIKPSILQYRKIASVGTQLESLLEKFPAEQVLVVWNEDLQKQTLVTYRKVARFLEIDEGFVPDFQVLEANRKWVHSYWRRMYYGLCRFNAERNIRLNLGILKALSSFGMKPVTRAPLPDAFLEELKAEFRPEVKKLSTLLHRDLTDWM